MVFEYGLGSVRDNQKPQRFQSRSFDRNLRFNRNGSTEEEIQAADRTLKYIQLLKESIPHLNSNPNKSTLELWLQNALYILTSLGFTGSNPYTDSYCNEIESFIVNSALLEILKEEKQSLEFVYFLRSSKSNLTMIAQHHNIQIVTSTSLLKGLSSIEMGDFEDQYDENDVLEEVCDYFKEFSKEYGMFKNKNKDETFTMDKIHQGDISIIALNALASCESLMDVIDSCIEDEFFTEQREGDPDSHYTTVIVYLNDRYNETGNNNYVGFPYWTYVKDAVIWFLEQC